MRALSSKLEAPCCRRETAFVWLGLGASVFLDTAIQLSWKTAVSPAPLEAGLWRTVLYTLNQPVFHITLLLILIQFVNWMTVLARTDLSYSQPITALSLISVTVCSRLFLHEHIPFLRIIGLALILTGVWLVGRTGHRTPLRVPEMSPGNALSENAGE